MKEIIFKLNNQIIIIDFIKKKFLFFLLFFPSLSSFGQNLPVAKFDFIPIACIEEKILLFNESSNFDAISWDLCPYDNLSQIPISTRILSSKNFGSPYHIKMLEDDKSFHGFIGAKTLNEIIRLDFNNDLETEPNYINLGGNDILNDPSGIDIIKDGNSWIGLVTGYTSNKLYLLNFGNKITNIPTITDISYSINLNLPMSVKIVKEDSNIFAYIVNNASGQYPYIRLDFGSSLLNTPSANEFLIPSSNQLTTIDIIKSKGEWFGFIVSRGNKKVFRLSFGASIANTPIITEITSPNLLLDDPGGLNSVIEGDSAYVFVQSRNGPLYKYYFPNGFSNIPQEKNLGNIYNSNRTWGLNLIKKESNWYGFNANFGNAIYRLNFDKSCNLPFPYSEESSPTISYSAPGTYDITLTATDGNGNSSSVTKQITVLDQQAPQINIQTDANLCLDNSTTFTAQNLTPSQTLTSHTWDFGDGTTASGSEVSHQYTEPGIYKVRLTVESEEGCGNFIEKEVNIYETPEPDFSFPTDVLCTNGAIAFQNLTPGDFKDDIAWLWDFGDGTTASERNPSHTYTSGGTKTVTLTASIPGCSASVSHTLEVIEGPNVDFSATNLCFGDEVQFNNLTVGDDITAYAWDFGNGEVSSDVNPATTYGAPGTYTVSLMVSTASGCSTTTTKSIIVRGLPEVVFVHAMACSGLTTAFEDRSVVVEGSISSWLWDFGDGHTSTLKNPAHAFEEPGTYEVKLIATSSHGCVDSTIQTVLVKAAPKANFTVEVGCPGTLSRFTDASMIPENDQIVGWVWVINSATFYSKNPEIPFSQSGAYEVKLTVNSSNGCSSTITKTIVIDPLPTPDFIAGNVCTGDKTVFTDISLGGGSDEIVDWQWQIGAITSNEQHPEVIFSQAENVSVRLTVTTARGCTASTQKIIKVNALPHAAFTVQKSFGAPPLQVNFKNNTSGAVSYQWLFGDPENSTSSEENPSFVYTTLGRYEAKLVATNAAGCNDTTSVFIETLIPELDVALEQLNTYTTQGDMQIVLKIVNKGSITIDNMDITLDLGGQLTLKEQFSGSILAGESLNYPLGINILEKDIAKVPYICASISINNVEFVEDDRENNSACREIAVEFVLLTPYPNPINDLFHLNFVMPEKAPVRLMLMDMLGKKVMDMELQATKVGYNEYSLDFSSLTAGSYVMKISHQNNMYLRKVMVK